MSSNDQPPDQHQRAMAMLASIERANNSAVGGATAAIQPGRSNPANPNAVATPQPERRRIPLSVPRRKLEVDPIKGYVLYWFLEKNTMAALDAGYEFVDRDEVRLNQTGQASSTDSSGNTDLGSRVSVIGNPPDPSSGIMTPERLVLMKIREDWWLEDRKILDDRNAHVIDTIFFRNQHISGPNDDRSQVYSKTSVINGQGKLFNRGLKKQVS